MDAFLLGHGVYWRGYPNTEICLFVCLLTLSDIARTANVDVEHP